MREIKFRAWSPKRQKFIDYNYQLGVEYDENEFAGCIFQQFTGLKDANGKEIYEGDLLTYGDSYPNYEVRYSSGCFWYENIVLYKAIPSLKIVGNIYESK